MAKSELYNIDDVINYHINKINRKTRLSREELYQIAYVGYLKAQENYDPSYGQMSLSYASRYITYQLSQAVKDDNKHRFREEELKEDREEFELERKDLQKTINAVKKNLYNLTEQEQDIIYHFYLAPKTKRLVDLADQYGVTKQRIHTIKSLALKKLRRLVKDETK